MHIVIAGASGFLGSHLSETMRGRGHAVTPLVRRPPAAGESRWDPYSGTLDQAVIEDADVVVNLAGTPTAGNPHSAKWARGMRESRVTTTAVLANAIAGAGVEAGVRRRWRHRLLRRPRRRGRRRDQRLARR